MKQQRLTITYHDYRYQPPRVRTKTYTNHGEYLHDMAQLVKLGEHVSEETTTVLHIYPQDQLSLFEASHDPPAPAQVRYPSVQPGERPSTRAPVRLPYAD